MTAPPAHRVRVRLRGRVQGVGFRPHVHRLAGELRLGGWVRNDERGVLLEAEGEPKRIEAFMARLEAEAPPLASVSALRSEPVEPRGEDAFRILSSGAAGAPDAAVAPDSASCADCLAELFDPADRRYRYPFVNCTNCGPRFTIVSGVPYDRSRTTMARFRMCERCRAEYDDPGDRRFHAQPNACPDCGPRARLVDATGAESPAGDGADALAAAAEALADGRILAVKGVGGYHLACLAADEGAVAALRARKRREERPFALMAPDAEWAGRLVALGRAERLLLEGRERPIVVARRGAAAEVAGSVAPGSPELGVMLPYSPLHHLLLADLGAPLVMTSGNASGEPIAHRDDDARERLAGIADLFLVHDRPIETRADDSVLRSLQPAREAPLLIRRSRGYAPEAIALPVDGPELLACGAEQKNTFCLARGRSAWVGPHVGDLENPETLTGFREGIERLERLFGVTPALLAHDLHPDYLSTRYAQERSGIPRVAVQHHHAHLAACLAEHGRTGPALGAIFDGTGLGTDGTIWGGELLAGGLDGFERAGHLWPVTLPGGAGAVREPWRMACSWLVAATGSPTPSQPPALAAEIEPRRWRQVCELIATGVASPATTSMGRLFDAVAALCGIRPTTTYEGQAAVELEWAADPRESGAYPAEWVSARRGPGTLDARPLVRRAAEEAAEGAPAATVSARAHNGIASATATALVAEAERRGISTLVLSGGVFQNRLLLERVLDRLAPSGLSVLIPERLPPNDGGISFGQAAVAAAGGGVRLA